MKSRKTIVRKAFWLDLDEAVGWYEAERSGFSYELEEEVIAAIYRIEERAESYPVWDEPVRKLLLPRFPFLIGFVIEGDRVFVLGLVHGMRDLPRWLSRRLEEE
jgi:hypothetical protein